MKDVAKKKMRLLAATGVILIAFVIRSAAMEGSGAAAGKRGEEAADTAVYVLCEENNRLVVYKGDSVYLKTDTLLSALPKSDRVKLEKGIVVFSEKELKELVQDYCS